MEGGGGWGYFSYDRVKYMLVFGIVNIQLSLDIKTNQIAQLTLK